MDYAVLRSRLMHVLTVGWERLRASAGLASSPTTFAGDRSEFVLASIDDEAFAALRDAMRTHTPVRIRSLRRPLYLRITHLERAKNGVKIAGRLACRIYGARG